MACAREVEGSERSPVQLRGPAARAPEIGRDEEAGDASEEHSDDEDCGDKHREDPGSWLVAEASIAVDPTHDFKPVKMMQALQGNIEALQKHAANIIRNEQTAKIEDRDGVLQPVLDEGGRQCMQALVLDVQATARSFGEAAQAVVERAVANTDRRLTVCPTALAIPTQAPMDSFHATTWLACYVEWWFGGGAPGLERDRPMLFEQVANRVIEIEEHEYTLEADEVEYRTSCKSRFNTPEIIAVLGDVVRRPKLLKRTRATVGRRGFGADLKALATAFSEDFMRP